ncbi:MAG: MBL fold metallo-hydrolase [Thermodesulfobacteriota bacterium]
MKGSMMDSLKKCLGRSIYFLLLSFLLLGACGAGIGTSPEKIRLNSDHFDGNRYFNPDLTSDGREESRRGALSALRYWMTMINWPEWPAFKEFPPGPPPAARVPKGTLRITAIGHSTFLIQMDGLNILTDPIWSDRCSPVSWAGPRRHSRPGLRLDDLPPIDAVLVSHNHYDHLDLPTLKQLAGKGALRALVPLGNGALVRESGISAVDELDWWQSVPLSSVLTVTVVPAQHFSSRTLWDRNRALWGGFVLSGPSGNVYFSGDTGYGPHFREIARRFSPIRVALLPISPFRLKSSNPPSTGHHLPLHMGPGEAVQAHLDLGAEISVAAHFQVFQLGADKFDDAADGLAQALKEGNLKPDTFLVLNPGQAKDWPTP